MIVAYIYYSKMSDIKPNLTLLIEQYDKEKEMKIYSNLHKLEKLNNYKNKIPRKGDKSELAEYIYENYEKMDDTEKSLLAIHCLDPHDIKRILLSFELENYYQPQLDKSLSLNDFLVQAQKVLRKYQCKGGGFLIDDHEWTVYKYNDQNKYDMQENELILENIIHLCDKDDTELDKYLNNIGRRLDSLTNNIDIEISNVVHEKQKRIYIIIKAIDTNINKDSIVAL